MGSDPRKLTAMYEAGNITLPTLQSLAVEIASESDPEVYADSLPDVVLRNIRDQTENPPEQEQLIILKGGMFTRDFDYEQDEQLQKRNYLAGLENWRIYFASIDDKRTSASRGLEQLT